jgi:hypothetical protein
MVQRTSTTRSCNPRASNRYRACLLGRSVLRSVENRESKLASENKAQIHNTHCRNYNKTKLLYTSRVFESINWQMSTLLILAHACCDSPPPPLHLPPPPPPTRSKASIKAALALTPRSIVGAQGGKEPLHDDGSQPICR